MYKYKLKYKDLNDTVFMKKIYIYTYKSESDLVGMTNSLNTHFKANNPPSPNHKNFKFQIHIKWIHQTKSGSKIYNKEFIGCKSILYKSSIKFP